MKAIIRFLPAAAVAAGALGAGGCMGGNSMLGERYKNAVDPCWPERYNAVARAEALAPFQAQALNGDVLDHTLWNYHFEAEGDKLTAAGLEKLDYLVRRRPAPEARLFLQTARDVNYDANAPQKGADKVRDLDQRRGASVQKYLAAATASRPMAFEVQVIDPSDPGFGAQYPANAIRQLPGQYKASRAGGGGGGGSQNFS